MISSGRVLLEDWPSVYWALFCSFWEQLEHLPALALFAVGGIISLIGTGFLIGFKTQLEKMFKPVRIIATVLMLASIVMTFVSAFVLPTILCIIFVIIQYLAYLWYALSYIPYARTMVKNMVGM
nr:hypothetical protein I308_01377 [Cryptococcus tetragattii IND107]